MLVFCRLGSRILHVSSYFYNLHCVILLCIAIPLCCLNQVLVVVNMFAATQLELTRIVTLLSLIAWTLRFRMPTSQPVLVDQDCILVDSVGWTLPYLAHSILWL